jgi:hypothetical protein
MHNPSTLELVRDFAWELLRALNFAAASYPALMVDPLFVRMKQQIFNAYMQAFRACP